MHRSSLFGWMFFASSSLLLGQTPPAAPAKGNPFDLSSAKEQIGDLGIPSVSAVEEEERSVSALVESGNCKDAIPALERYARRVNTLANLVVAGLRPFYDASYDRRKSFGGTGNLVRYETMANELKAKRNRAMVMQAECFIKLAQPEKAAPLLVKALDAISIEEEEWWGRARNDLYQLIGVR